MKRLRYLSALVFPALAVLVAGGPLGCSLVNMPGLPDAMAPKTPQLPEMPSAPSTPQVQAPITPSAPTVPDTPKMDVPAGEDTEVCCLRSGKAESFCGGGTKKCCTIKLDRDQCDSSGGFWFSSAQGCAGAC